VSPSYRFSVVRYVPDPIRDERINIGVVVVIGDAVEARFLQPNQSVRLKRFRGGGDFRFLRALERRINRAAEDGQLQLDLDSAIWTPSTLRAAVREWGGVIQFAPLRGGIVREGEPPIDALFERYVVVPKVASSRQDRQTLRARVGRTLRRVVSEKYPRRDSSKWVQRDRYVGGRLEDHQFDYVVGNGRPLHLVQTFSFDVDASDQLRKEIDATAWAITDLRRVARVPVSVVTVGQKQSELIDVADAVFNSLGADFVEEPMYEAWANRLAARLPKPGSRR
jgi:hypothetical protein